MTKPCHLDVLLIDQVDEGEMDQRLIGLWEMIRVLYVTFGNPIAQDPAIHLPGARKMDFDGIEIPKINSSCVVTSNYSWNFF